MNINYIQNWNETTDKLKNSISLHKFLNTSFNKLYSGKNNLTISNFKINISSKKLVLLMAKLYKTFYEIPNACELSQYSEFISAVLYEINHNANSFITEGSIIKHLRFNSINMEGHSPPDIYMSYINGKATLISVTRFNSKWDVKRRAYNLLDNKIRKSMDSIDITFPILKTDRCIIQIFCKTIKNIIVLKNTFLKMSNIPKNIYIHIVYCNHSEIYENNKLY